MDRVTILGDGQMALVLADALVVRGVQVCIWAPLPDHAQTLRATRRSPRLPDLVLPDSVRVTTDDCDAVSEATLIVNAIPTQFIRSVWQRLRDHVVADAPVVSVSKGIENETLLRPAQVIAAIAGDDRPLCALSGPTIAAELASRLPAAMVAASRDRQLVERVQDVLNVPWLRIYGHDDVLGVELAGATKNVIALAAGMIDGLKAGDNAKSALLARGLAEIARLGTAMGARLDTFFGIAGVGDLATTCFSPRGRNRSCGERLGRGDALDEVLRDSQSVVEGVPTTRSVMELAQREGVDMPIATAVYEILFEGLAPSEAIRNLMSREMKAEQIG